MKKLLKSDVCGSHEQCKGALFTQKSQQSQLKKEEKKKKRKEKHKCKMPFHPDSNVTLVLDSNLNQ